MLLHRHLVLMFFFRKPRVLLPLEIILLMWVLTFRLFKVSTPRYLAVSTVASVWLCMVYWLLMGWPGYMHNDTPAGLNSISHSCSHFWSRFTSSCNWCQCQVVCKQTDLRLYIIISCLCTGETEWVPALSPGAPQMCWVVGWCEGVMYLLSPGRPADIGL